MQSGKSFVPEEIKKMDAIPMNFVLGKERSGTTLLQLMLNAHPSIVAPPESRFIILLYYKYGKTQKWTEKLISNFCNDLFKEGLFRNFWGIGIKELKLFLITAKDVLTFPLICKIIFRLSSPEKKDISIFFDKNPVYYYFLPELNQLFPEAKYIHLIRDYRANLVSHRRVFTVKRSTDIAYRWMKVNMIIEEAKKKSPEKYFTLTYESLVSNPDKKMEEVCRFLNLPFEAVMVKNHQSGMYSKFSGNIQKGFRKVHEKVFQSIDTSFIDSWKDKISEKDLMEVDAITGTYAEDMYGYKRISTGRRIENKRIMMDLKYMTIKLLYHKALANLWLYYKIKHYVWRNF